MMTSSPLTLSPFTLSEMISAVSIFVTIGKVNDRGIGIDA